MWSEQGLVISPNHILLLGRSQLNLHLYQPVHWHPPLPIASLATGCRHIYTSRACPATWQPYGCTCTFFLGTFSKEKVVKICSDVVRRHGTRQTYNVQCHDNTDTVRCSSHSFPLGLLGEWTACSFLTVKPDFLSDWQLTDNINSIRRGLCCLPLMPTPWG